MPHSARVLSVGGQGPHKQELEGNGCTTATGSGSLTLSFSVARISSLLKKEMEGSECQ